MRWRAGAASPGRSRGQGRLADRARASRIVGQHRRLRLLPAVRQGRPDQRPVRLPGLLHQRHARAARARTSCGQLGHRRPPPELVAVDLSHPSITLDLHDVDHHARPDRRRASSMTRRREHGPGPRPERDRVRLRGPAGFAMSLGGPRRPPLRPALRDALPVILLSNWSGLLPLVGRIEQLRAPTSDVNITIGLALVSFVFFHIEGFRAPRRRRLPRQVLPASASSRTASAAGVIALFVGLIEFMLEFVKPVTLSMRLFGNIYGGEVALGVITGPDHRVHPGRHARPGVHAQLRPGPDLLRPHADVHLIAIEGHHEEDEHARGRARRRRHDRHRRARRSSPRRPTDRAPHQPRSQSIPGRPPGE